MSPSPSPIRRGPGTPILLAAIAGALFACGRGAEVAAQGPPYFEPPTDSGEEPAADRDPDDMSDWAYLEAHTPSIQATTEWDGTINGMKTLWHPNGAKLGEGEYVNSEKNGPWTYWHDNGQKRWEGTYVADVPRGLERTWYDDGTPQYVGKFIDGLREGPFSYWYENGQLWWQGPFKHGLREGRFLQWRRNGDIDEDASGMYHEGKRVAPLSEEALAKALRATN